MAHWAEIDNNNYVIRVLVMPDDDLEVQNLIENYLGGKWIKTSYNTFRGKHKNDGVPLRKNFAGSGYYYDSERDAFIPPKPYDSFLFNEEECNWDPPKIKPVDEYEYWWDENIQDWSRYDK